MNNSAPPVQPNPLMDIYARPGRLAQINRRRRLNLQVMGQGGPTVVLAAGFLGGPLDWGLVQPFLAQSVRTASFDTAGLGFSDPGRLPRTTDAIVSDLHAALTAEGIRPPYVLVGHSAGGLRMRRFAAMYPEEVVGMVLVDSVTDDWEHRIYGGPCPGMAAERVVFRRMLALARLGQLTPETPDYRERVGLPRAELTPAVNKALHEMWTRPSYLRTAISEGQNIGSAGSPGPPPPSLGDLPLTVLSAGRIADNGFIGDASLAQVWFAMHNQLASLSSRGTRRVVDSRHDMPIERPREVIAAIEEVVRMAEAQASATI
jgi:pimeloyl-ACP methyl ester carboxylesterase